jgi:hypothetical protein
MENDSVVMLVTLVKNRYDYDKIQSDTMLILIWDTKPRQLTDNPAQQLFLALGRAHIRLAELIKSENKKCPSSNLGGTGCHLLISSYHKIYVLLTKAWDEKLKFEKAHFYLWN